MIWRVILLWLLVVFPPSHLLVTARPTGYGAVPGFRPLALGHGANVAQSSAWRGRWTDLSGYYNLGLRIYDPVAGMWLSYDPEWNELDPNYLTFCGGDPVNGFDPQGKCENNTLPNLQTTIYPNENVGPFLSDTANPSPLPQPYVNPNEPYTVSVINQDDAAIGQNLAAIGQDVAIGTQVAAVMGTVMSGVGIVDAVVAADSLNAMGAVATADTMGATAMGSTVDGTLNFTVNPGTDSVITDPARLLPETTSAGTPGTSFYVTADGTTIPATGYRAVGGTAVQQAQVGNLMSGSGTTYFTFTDISGMNGTEAGGVLQLPFTPSYYATFDTLQIIDDINIPGENWNRSLIPEPITTSFPEFGPGGGTQAITKTPILNYTLQPLTK